MPDMMPDKKAAKAATDEIPFPAALNSALGTRHSAFGIRHFPFPSVLSVRLLFKFDAPLAGSVVFQTYLFLFCQRYESTLDAACHWSLLTA